MVVPNFIRLLFAIFIALQSQVVVAQLFGIDIMDTLMGLYRRGQNTLDLEALDENVKILEKYDFIIVGAGTAGCALAARLAENPDWKILLIEAGDAESYIMDIPILVHFLQLGNMNWKYKTEPSNAYCLAMEKHRCNWPRGKVMGGSSVLNYMIYTRGNRRDYDNWAALGNEGWSYADVLPYFKKLEGSTVPDAESKYVGRKGPVKISYLTYRTKIADAFVAAAQQDGLKYRDYNGRTQVGVSYLQTNSYNATRWSSNRAYLYPLKGRRRNLHILKRAMVTKVLIDPKTKTAQGVLISRNGKSFEVSARLEVILTAGAINTPQLLMLSGIGPAKHLRQMNIEPLADLAVGYNLQDHTAPGVTFTTNATSLHVWDIATTKNIREYEKGGGPFGLPGGCETIAFYALDKENANKPGKSSDAWPDIELFMVSGGFYTNLALRYTFGFDSQIYETLFGDLSRKDADAFIIFPMILRPKSRGRIMLNNTDPFQHPLIYANYYSHPYDLDITVRGLQQAISLMDQPAFQAIDAKVHKKPLPACEKFGFATSAYWACYARYFTLTIYHYAGTAKMGPRTDPSAVVDPRLRVYGINKLRVVDASIMPQLIAGHPNGPIFMIAEKAADMIKEDHDFIT